MPKKKEIKVRMDPAFHAKVKQYCSERGCTMSEAIRSSLRDALIIAGYFDKPQVDRTPAHGISDN